jgi:hypothetical protein
MEVHADFDGWSVNRFENRYKKLRKKDLAGMYLEMRVTKHRNMWCQAKLKLGVLIILVTLTGCAARGPQTVARDAFDYSAAISKSRSDQMLLNIVRIRYMQVPNFLTVSSVIAGYTYQGNLGVSAQTGVGRFEENFIGGSINLNYIERPTITYNPLQGQEFSRRLLRNIPVDVLISLAQAGWPMDVLFRIAVERFGETQNMSFSATKLVGQAGEQAENLTRYDHVVNSIMKLGDAGVVETVQSGVADETRLTVRFARSMSAEQMETAAELKSLLGIHPDRNEFYVTDHILGRAEDEVLIQTRSMLAVLSFLGLGVEVPEADANANRVMVTTDSLKSVIEKRGPMRIRTQKEKPKDPFAAIQYRDYWFYIEATDRLSQRTFATTQLLFELLAPSGSSAAPFLSLPTS